VAGLDRVRPDLRARGGELVVVGSGGPEHIVTFRQSIAYEGRLLCDPSLASFQAARLVPGWSRTFDQRAIIKAIRALAGGFRPGVPRGSAVQQGGTFVLGPGPRVRFEWRDRYPGDHPPIGDVLSALDA
jgi:AhpC/TSA antioxidant enzyme